MWMTLRKRGFIIFSAEERGGGGGRLRLYVFFHHEGDFKDGPGRRTKPPLGWYAHVSKPHE